MQHLQRSFCNQQGCIEKAFRERRVDNSICTDDIHQANLDHTTAVRLEENSLLFLTKEPTTLTIKCLDESSKKIKIMTHSILTANAPCVVNSDNIAMYITETKELESVAHLKTNFSLDVDFKQQVKMPSLPHLGATEIQDIKQLGEKMKQLKANQVQLNSIRTANNVDDISDVGKLTTLIAAIVISLILVWWIVRKCFC